MLIKFKTALISFLVMVFILTVSSGQAIGSEKEEGRLMLGVQRMDNYISGLSVIYDLNDKLSLQGVVGTRTWSTSNTRPWKV